MIKVMIVEDEPEIRRILGKMIEKQALELIIKDSKETEITRKLAQERLAIL